MGVAGRQNYAHSRFSIWCGQHRQGDSIVAPGRNHGANEPQRLGFVPRKNGQSGDMQFLRAEMVHPNLFAPLAIARAEWNKAVMNRDEMTRRLELLRVEHRDLDSAIAALAATPVPDQLAMARLKKRKLRLRDEISWIEDSMIPDIIA